MLVVLSRLRRPDAVRERRRLLDRRAVSSMRVGFAGLGAPKGLAGSVLSAKHWELEAPRCVHEEVGFEPQCHCKAHTLLFMGK